MQKINSPENVHIVTSLEITEAIRIPFLQSSKTSFSIIAPIAAIQKVDICGNPLILWNSTTEHTMDFN